MIPDSWSLRGPKRADAVSDRVLSHESPEPLKGSTSDVRLKATETLKKISGEEQPLADSSRQLFARERCWG